MTIKQKVNFLYLTFLFSLTLFSQESETIKTSQVFLFESAENLINNKGEYAGEYVSYSWSNKIYAELNRKKNKINLNKYWGFKIGPVFFRMNNTKPKIPLQIIGINDKIFYLNGYFYLNKLAHNHASSRSNDNIFYSNALTEDIRHIDKITHKEKDNIELKSLCDCIKKAKKRYGDQAKFNGKYKCINSFLETPSSKLAQ